MYFYKAEITYHDEDESYFINFPAFKGNCFSDGKAYRDALEEGAEALKLVIATYLDEGWELPEENFGNQKETIVVGVEVSQEFMEMTKCLTIKEAAAELEVSPSRVSQLLNSGQLQAVTFGKSRMVTIESVNKRIQEGIHNGRPKKKTGDRACIVESTAPLPV